MAITTITTPAPDTMLTTLKTAICELGIEDESENARVERFIRRASAKLVSLSNRVFAEERVTETVKSHGRTQLMLTRTPIVEIHEVTYDNNVITDYSIDDREAGLLYRQYGWIWTVGLMSGASGITSFPAPSTEEAKFTIDYTAGYVLPSFPIDFTQNANSVELPMDVEDFCLQVVKLLYHARATDPNLKSEKIGDYSYTKGAGADSAFYTEQAAFVDKWGRIK